MSEQKAYLDKESTAYLWSKIKETFKQKEVAATISVSPSLFEKGVSTSVKVSWTSKLDGSQVTPESSFVTQGDDGKIISETANSSTTVTISDTTKFTHTTTVSGTSKSATATATAVYPMYFGSSANSTLTSDNVLAMTKQAIKSSPAGSYSVAVSASQYMWLCVPSTMTINKVTSSGFDVPLEAAATVSVTGKITYKCYRSSSTYVAGTVNIVIS